MRQNRLVYHPLKGSSYPKRNDPTWALRVWKNIIHFHIFDSRRLVYTCTEITIAKIIIAVTNAMENIRELADETGSKYCWMFNTSYGHIIEDPVYPCLCAPSVVILTYFSQGEHK